LLTDQPEKLTASILVLRQFKTPVSRSNT
jgi:hypothetical protein